MKFTQLLTAGLLSASSVVAHPHHESYGTVVRKNAQAKRCAESAAHFNEKRYNRRVAKRHAEQLKKRYPGKGNTTVELTVEAPYYDVIQNDTCVLSPDITQGPYVFPRSQMLRQDMTEDQVGVPLWLDVGVLDMNTCEPLPNALVSFWHCNATGSYSSFSGLDPNTPFRQLLAGMNISYEEFQIGVNDIHTDDSTWLRGLWPTNEEGLLEMKTIFPGFYVERAIHIHAMVYTDWKLGPNGTVATGNIANVGQIYFEEDVEAQIMALEPYNRHTQVNRTRNWEDRLGIFDTGFANGYNPVATVVPADGEDITKGMIGYITFGVDPAHVADLHK